MKHPRLDWDRQFEALAPLLASQVGGFVQVHASATAPTNVFCAVLRDHLELASVDFKWTTVLITPDYSGTYLVQDIVDHVATCCNLSLNRDPSPIFSPTVNVGTQIEAGGDVSVGDVDITLVANPGSGRSRVKELCRLLDVELETRRIALIFEGFHRTKKKHRNRMAKALWEGGLSDLVGRGLLVVDVSDPCGEKGDWPPDNPKIIIDLPDRYDQSAEQAAARDLAAVATHEGLAATPEEGALFARYCLAMSEDVRSVYANLGMVRARLIPLPARSPLKHG